MLVAILATSHACHSEHGKAHRTKGGDASVDVGADSAISILMSKPADEESTADTTCGLSTPDPIELMPLLHGKVVLSRSLHAVRLVGAPRLVFEANVGGYYLAESTIDPESLPNELQGLPDTPVHFVDANGRCHGKLGNVSAWAWADRGGSAWQAGNPAVNALRVFRDGDSFLVADVAQDCGNENFAAATWRLPARFHSWRLRSLSEEPGNDIAVRLMERGLAALQTEPGLAVTNAAYERFRRGSEDLLPKRWWLLPQSYVYWSLATDAQAALLIAELQSRSFFAKHTFTAAWFAIWCIGAGGKLTSLSPDYVPHEFAKTITSFHHHLEIAGAPGELPLILYSSYALRPQAGHYTFYDYALPSPPALE